MTIIPSENFANSAIGTLFTVLLFTILVIELSILSKPRLSGGFGRDKKSFLYILLGLGLALFSIFIFPILGIGNINTNFSYFGIILMILGFTLRQWSIRILGKLFTPIISIQEGHKLIIRGPYKYVRHPSYTSLLVEYLGFALAVSNWISFVAVICFLFPAMLYRIKIEEKELVKRFGQDYISYRKRTKMLIPWII